MTKLALGMICAPTDEEALLLDRCLKSVAKHVDGIFVTITGKNKKCENVVSKYNGVISHFKWDDDFAAARNYNLSRIPEEYTHYVWFDCDDIVVGASNLKRIVDKLNSDNITAAVTDYLYAFDEYGCCVARHPKTRIVALNGNYSWSEQLGELHEDLQPKRQEPIAFLQESEPKFYFEVHHKKTEEAFKKTAERNLKISKRQYDKHRDDPRSLWNYGNSLIGVGDSNTAIGVYQEFIQKSGSEQEKYLALIRMSAIFVDGGNFDWAVAHADQAMNMFPWQPDAYIALGKAFYKQGKWRHAKEFLIQGMSKEIPKEAVVYNPRDYDLNPLTLLTNCYFNMGKPREALKVITNLLQKFPGRTDLEPVKKVLVQSVKEQDIAMEFVDKASSLSDAELAVELESLPENIKMQPEIAVVRNERFIREEAPEKEITYYCGFTTEVWNRDSEKSGIGGSEEAVLNLSREWAKMGYNVVVYNNCGPKELTDEYGVIWKPYWTFNHRSQYDILLLWRSPLLANYDLRARCVLLDLHDVLPTAELSKERLNRIDRILVKSNYHRSLFPDVPDSKFLVIGNGINPEHFINDGSIKRIPHRLIYTSSPDRGLEHLLRGWKRVRESIPDAELQVFYGWSVFDSVHSQDPTMVKWKEEIKELMKQDGIVTRGRVGHEQIAKEMMMSGIYAYPCHFEEIFCISAVKAQAAGCEMVTTDYAALDEVVFNGTFTEKGEWDLFIEVLIARLNKKGVAKPGVKGRVGARKIVDVYAWSNIAKQWKEIFVS